MPAAKYEQEATYLLRMEADDKQAYEAAARGERLALVDWINQQLRQAVRNQKRRNAA